jgi:hypothetical protein
VLFRPRSPGTWNYEIGSGTKTRGTSPDRARLKEPEHPYVKIIIIDDDDEREPGELDKEEPEEEEPEPKVEVRTHTVKKTGEQAPGPWFKEPEGNNPDPQEEE